MRIKMQWLRLLARFRRWQRTPEGQWMARRIALLLGMALACLTAWNLHGFFTS